MKKAKTPFELGKRERQIYETVASLGEASVSEVLQQLAQPPSYSAVRATLMLLVEKNWLKFRKDGQKYYYSLAGGKSKAQRTALKRMLNTFFEGSTKDAVVALLDVSSNQLSEEEFQQISEQIEKARKEKPKKKSNN